MIAHEETLVLKKAVYAIGEIAGNLCHNLAIHLTTDMEDLHFAFGKVQGEKHMVAN